MIFLLLSKMLSDLSYYFVFANYIGGYIGINYSLALSAGALSLAFALSGMLEKKGLLRLLPPALCLALLLQCRSIMDFVVLIPPMIYLWVSCIKRFYLPDGNEYKEIFALQLKTLFVLPLIFAFKADVYVLKHYCLPALILFLCSSVLAMRMLRHSTEVLSKPRFMVQNGCTVAGILLMAWACSSQSFLRVFGKVVASIRWVLAPVLEGLAYALSYIVSLFVSVVMGLFGLLSKTFGNDNYEKPQITVPEGVKEEENLLQDYVAPDSKTFVTIVMVIVIIIGLICAYYIFKRMLNRRGKQDSAGFYQTSLQEENRRRERDRLTAPKDPREAVRWHYRRFLKHLKSKNLHIKASYNSEQINELAQVQNIAQPADTGPLREIYINTRYSENAVTQDDVRQAKELVKRIKDGQ